jgi:hypothetical protein
MRTVVGDQGTNQCHELGPVERNRYERHSVMYALALLGAVYAKRGEDLSPPMRPGPEPLPRLPPGAPAAAWPEECWTAAISGKARESRSGDGEREAEEAAEASGV